MMLEPRSGLPEQTGTISNTIRGFLTNTNAARLSQASRAIQATLVFEKKIANQIIALCKEAMPNIMAHYESLIEINLPFDIYKWVDDIYNETQDLLCGGLLPEDLIDHREIYDEIYETNVTEQFTKNIGEMRLFAHELRSIKHILDPMFRKPEGSVSPGQSAGRRSVKRKLTRRRNPPARKTKKRKLKPCLTRKK